MNSGVACLPEYSSPKAKNSRKDKQIRAIRIPDDQPKITDYFFV